jgi:hypothetical protein
MWHFVYLETLAHQLPSLIQRLWQPALYLQGYRECQQEVMQGKLSRTISHTEVNALIIKHIRELAQIHCHYASQR